MIAMDRNHRDNRLLLGLENRDSKRSYGSKVSTWGGAEWDKSQYLQVNHSSRVADVSYIHNIRRKPDKSTLSSKPTSQNN